MCVCVYTIPSPFNSLLSVFSTSFMCFASAQRSVIWSALKPTPTRRRCQTLSTLLLLYSFFFPPFFPVHHTTHTRVSHYLSTTDWQSRAERKPQWHTGGKRHTKRDAACHSCCCHFLFFCCWLLTSSWKRVSSHIILFLFFCKSNNGCVESNEIANNNSVGIFSKNWWWSSWVMGWL